MPFGDIFLIISFASSGETAIKRPITVYLIDAREVKLSDYSCPGTKSSKWTAAIEYPRDHPPITNQTGARRTNHNRAFCYRYDYYINYMVH